MTTFRAGPDAGPMAATALPADEGALSRTRLWMVPAALLLHLMEEAWAAPLMLSQISEVGTRMTGRTVAVPGVNELLGLIVLLAAVAFGLLLLTRVWRAGLYLLVLLQGAMALNVLSHTSGALTVGDYSPGLLTAWLIEAPLSVVIVRRLRDERWMTRRKWIALAPSVLLLHGPVLRAALWAAAVL